MAYENITIGTEQELSNVHLVIQREAGSRIGLDQNSKVIVSIYNDKMEKLVNVTADTWVADTNCGDAYQVEFITEKAGSNDESAWNQRKEAIKLFVEKFIPTKNDADICQYIVSGVEVDMPGKHSASYKCRGNVNDNRQFYFERIENSGSVRFSNQLTIGIEYKDLLNEYKKNALNDKNIWGMLWLKDCSDELYEPLGVVNPTEEQKFLYSYICSVFDYSVNVYARMNPDHESFINKNRNSSKEKNMWNVLPRSMVSCLLNHLEEENRNVYNFFRDRPYNDGKEPEKIRENRIYETMAAKFWKRYDAGNFFKADLLLRAGIIGNTSNHFLFELRSVFNNIKDIYEDSGMYIYRPDREGI